MIKFPKTLYRRDLYINRIKPFMRTPIVKVMVGHRRVGKSFILFQLMELISKEEKSPNIIYINKEDIAFVNITTAQTLHQYISERLSAKKPNYIFIDEIQEIPDFRVAIRSLALDEQNDIYITGSNSEMFSSDLANELGGRYVEFRIYSLSFLEFLEFHSLPNDDASLEKYMRWGGLPYLIHLPQTDEVIMEYIRSVYSTIVLRDVIERNKIRNIGFIDQLIRFLANNIGSLFSPKSISDYLKSQQINMSPQIVSDYAYFLVSAFVMHQLGRYDVVGKRIFERGEKYFFENMGIRTAISGYTIQDRGKRLENVVCNHLLVRGYEVKVGVIDKEEIDFVCTRMNETIYVQVAAELSRTETIEREFGNLLRIQDNYPKIVVSLEQSFENTYLGVGHMYVRDFLSSDLDFRL